jgi:hypothetical protein
MAKNSKIVNVKLVEYYSEAFEKRVCCFCGKKLYDSKYGARKVACSPECRALARARAEKTLRKMVCVICEEELPAERTSSKRLCDKEQCKKESDWRRNLFRIHHIRAEDFYKMAEEQNWGCAICKEPLFFAIDGSKNQINVDHDHGCCPNRIGCGKCVRGILCNGCNGGMGLFRDNPNHLVAAAQYLENFKEKR